MKTTLPNDTVHAKGVWRITVRDKEGNIVSDKVRENVVVYGGAVLIASALGNDLTAIEQIQLNRQVLGTGTTTPNFNNSALAIPDNATWKILSDSSHTYNVLNITAFWDAGEAPGTWEEFAVYINGTNTPASGTMFNRLLLGAVEVGASNSLTVDGTVTFT